MSTVYLIPAQLDEEGFNALPAYILDAIKDCQVFFVENERTTRRYFKQLWKEMIIDNYEWFNMQEEEKAATDFLQKIKENKNIGIVSEAGCPGVADPGQKLIGIAQEKDVTIKPLVGPSSILLALMSSGLNGQRFSFHGYLPIDNQKRNQAIKELELSSSKEDSTQIFIETPYRNNQLLEAIGKNCSPNTLLCIAKNLTGPKEFIKTKPVKDWKNQPPELHKEPVIFLMKAETKAVKKI
jgi:16S rRNA (cytidine1402-2'-O)-methyltransferase